MKDRRSFFTSIGALFGLLFGMFFSIYVSQRLGHIPSLLHPDDAPFVSTIILFVCFFGCGYLGYALALGVETSIREIIGDKIYDRIDNFISASISVIFFGGIIILGCIIGAITGYHNYGLLGGIGGAIAGVIVALVFIVMFLMK